MSEWYEHCLCRLQRSPVNNCIPHSLGVRTAIVRYFWPPLFVQAYLAMDCISPALSFLVSIFFYEGDEYAN